MDAKQLQEKRAILDAERRKAYDEWMSENEAIDREMSKKKQDAYDRFVAITDRIDKEISALYWSK